MASKTKIERLFQLWCERNGYVRARQRHAAVVGNASLICRRGMFSIEVVREESEQTYAMRCKGALPGEVVRRGRGWDYPLLDASETRAEAFFAA